MSEDIRTLAKSASLDVEIKRSRFLAQVARCDDPEQALDWLQQVSDASATHNCWAFRIGQQYRFNDDGEPGGSAGRPILAAIEGQGLDHVVAVVTRWYGGVKLGVGGLARAYGGTVAQCLQQATQETLIAQTRCNVRCDFALEASVRQLIETVAGLLIDIDYRSDGLLMRLEIPNPSVVMFEEQLRDLSRGQAGFQQVPPTTATD